jgi:hypothetical protein
VKEPARGVGGGRRVATPTDSPTGTRDVSMIDGEVEVVEIDAASRLGAR